MSQEYSTDEEQVEALKRWWRENGKSTVISIVIAISGVFAWQGWQKQQQADVEAASAIYQNMLTVVESQPMTDDQRATANHLAETLKKDFSNSSYARFAGFYKAKFAVEKNDLDTAETELRWVLESNPSTEISLQAKLRLARVLYAKQELDAALAIIPADGLGYSAAFEELRGDIYNAKGEVSQARLAYQKAKDLNQQADSPVSNPLLNLKAEQLAGGEGA